MNRRFHPSLALLALFNLAACGASVPVGGNDGGDVATSDVVTTDTPTPSTDGATGCALPDGGICATGTTCSMGLCPDGVSTTSCTCGPDGHMLCTGACPSTDGGMCLELGATCSGGDRDCCSGYCNPAPSGIRPFCDTPPSDGGTADASSDAGPRCRPQSAVCDDFNPCCPGTTCMGSASGSPGRCYPEGIDTSHTCAVSGEPPCIGGHACITGFCPDGVTPVSCFCQTSGTLNDCTGACP